METAKEKIKYVVLKEKLGDETHEHELIEVFVTESLEEAERELSKITDLYARIEKIRCTYNRPPAGKIWRRAEYCWDREFIEVVKEN